MVSGTAERAGFRPQMLLFRNFGVNHAKDLTGPAESLVRRARGRLRANGAEFLELAENCPFLDRKHTINVQQFRLRSVFRAGDLRREARKEV